VTLSDDKVKVIIAQLGWSGTYCCLVGWDLVSQGQEDGGEGGRGGRTTSPGLEYIPLVRRPEHGAERGLRYNAWRFTSIPPSYSNDEVLWHNDN
jgi:hypothetical protein